MAVAAAMQPWLRIKYGLKFVTYVKLAESMTLSIRGVWLKTALLP